MLNPVIASVITSEKSETEIFLHIILKKLILQYSAKELFENTDPEITFD